MDTVRKESDSDDEEYVLPDIIEKRKCPTENVLSLKSRELYEIAYRKFMDWRMKNTISTFSEEVMVSYFEELSTSRKPSTLWAEYTKLKWTISLKHNTNIAGYPKLMTLLKTTSVGFKSRKPKTFTRKHINDFLKKAPDSKYLFTKVVLIVSISGACRNQELRHINAQDVEDTGKSLIFNIRDKKTKTKRTFVVSESFYSTCKKYMNLRPRGEDTKLLPFFLNYLNEKCTNQCVGKNKFGRIPKQIAEYLGLPDANEYTGHCFRRSATVGRVRKVQTYFD